MCTVKTMSDSEKLRLVEELLRHCFRGDTSSTTRVAVEHLRQGHTRLCAFSVILMSARLLGWDDDTYGRYKQKWLEIIGRKGRANDKAIELTTWIQTQNLDSEFHIASSSKGSVQLSVNGDDIKFNHFQWLFHAMFGLGDVPRTVQDFRVEDRYVFTSIKGVSGTTFEPNKYYMLDLPGENIGIERLMNTTWTHLRDLQRYFVVGYVSLHIDNNNSHQIMFMRENDDWVIYDAVIRQPRGFNSSPKYDPYKQVDNLFMIFKDTASESPGFLSPQPSLRPPTPNAPKKPPHNPFEIYPDHVYDSNEPNPGESRVLNFDDGT